MKTIELSRVTDYKQSIRLLKRIYKQYPIVSHFFFEPQLIIRTENYKLWKLFLKGIKIKVYSYPYTKTGFGESKKWEKLQPYLILLYKLQSEIVLLHTRKEQVFALNRMHHCMLNMMGFEFYEESKYYLGQSAGYMKHQYKSDGKILTLIIQKVIYMLWKLL
jgi:hypothetical protein